MSSAYNLQVKTDGVLPFIFAAGFLFAIAHSFIPVEQFIHRSDDAYYYFEIAVNYAKYGFWTFDGINPTNGVQPLWAIILSSFAKFLYLSGVEDKQIIARLFVALTATIHFLSCLLLFQILSRKVNLITAVIATGAFLFPFGILWSRVWGMENSLYSLLLLSTVYYFHQMFLKQESGIGSAIILGLLLGLTMLSRLNAGLFAVCIMSYYLLFRIEQSFSRRFYISSIVTIVSLLLVIPYFLHNLLSTGYFLPVSGVVKSIQTKQFLDTYNIPSIFTADFLKRVWWNYRGFIEWFLYSRSLDSTWIFGGRSFFFQDSDNKYAFIALWVTIITLLVFLRTGEAFRILGKIFSKLCEYTYFLVYGVLNAVISVFLYPTQLSYAMIRWWFVENKIIVVVITSIFIGTIITIFYSYFTEQIKRISVFFLVLLLSAHALQFYKIYWVVPYAPYDWRLSWNDEIYNASNWINHNLPESSTIGSWNAGLLGYYSVPNVVNLDGLVNNHELIPYLENNNVSQYILDKNIEYLSDLEPVFHHYHIYEKLELTEIYKSYSGLMQKDYYIYRVDGTKEAVNNNGNFQTPATSSIY